jgi:hypothetical protein
LQTLFRLHACLSQFGVVANRRRFMSWLRKVKAGPRLARELAGRGEISGPFYFHPRSADHAPNIE